MSVEKNILWFQVPIDYVLIVKLLDSDEDLGQVESRILESQAELLIDLEKELATWTKLEQEVQILLILHSIDKVNEETTMSLILSYRDFLENRFLILYMLDVFVAPYLVLFDLLQSE